VRAGRRRWARVGRRAGSAGRAEELAPPAGVAGDLQTGDAAPASAPVSSAEGWAEGYAERQATV
jgi:hypothetical protein